MILYKNMQNEWTKGERTHNQGLRPSPYIDCEGNTSHSCCANVYTVFLKDAVVETAYLCTPLQNANKERAGFGAVCVVRCPPTPLIAIAGVSQEKCHSSQWVMRLDIWHQNIIKTIRPGEEAGSFKSFRQKRLCWKYERLRLVSLQTIKCSHTHKKSKLHNICKEKHLRF